MRHSSLQNPRKNNNRAATHGGSSFEKLLLENLVDGVEEEDIHEFFSTVGNVHRVVMQGKGRGFVLVDPRDTLRLCLNSTKKSLMVKGSSHGEKWWSQGSIG